jgi:hypothetical protein
VAQQFWSHLGLQGSPIPPVQQLWDMPRPPTLGCVLVVNHLGLRKLMKNWIRSYFVVTKLPGRNILGKKKLKVFYPSSKEYKSRIYCMETNYFKFN